MEQQAGASAGGEPTEAAELSPLLRRLLTPARQESLRHVVTVPASSGQTAPWPPWTPAVLRASWASRGVDRPWSHQVAAAEIIRSGQDLVIATPTASGKSLAFQLPALTSVLAARRPNGRPGATVLYLSPTKALAADQLSGLAALQVPRLGAATHDGDSSREQRDWSRDHAEWLLTNPDMLHHSLLPDHARWSRFLGQLTHVVIDECHHYRGVFGAHVSLVLRRLRRVAASYGARPRFVLASATVADPEISAQRLIGTPVTALTSDTSRHGRLDLALWEPPLQKGYAISPGSPGSPGSESASESESESGSGSGSGSESGSGSPPGRGAGEHGAPVRRSAVAEAADLLTDLVIAEVRTLCFVRSRRAAESVAMNAAAALADVAPELADRVASYRGGYLPEDRRELEGALRAGRLLGLAATNALELGIDISGLDAVLMAGFPGTRAGLWQQAGRAGRGGAAALAVLVARDDPLDTYLVNHPAALIDAPVEASVFDPGNPYVIGPHLCAAAAEIPLRAEELPQFGRWAERGVEALCEAGLLRRRTSGWFWTGTGRAGDLADLRSSGGRAIDLVEIGTGRVIGTADAASAHGTVHEGAVYLHLGETYLVRSLDLADHAALLERAAPPYTTYARDVTDIEVVSEVLRDTGAWGECTLHFGVVRVSQQVLSYLKRRVPGGEVLGEEPLDLPVRVLETAGVWWTVPDRVWQEAGLTASRVPGAAHAAEHASIGLLPLVATCDRWDIGGVSTARHPDTGMLTVFVYDGHPGGAGFSERGYAVARTWLTATRDAIASCACESGCPSCVQSPKCGNQNSPLDKAGAILLLEALLGLRATG